MSDPVNRDAIAVRANSLSKSFCMHLQGGLELPVVEGASFEVRAGECVVLGGPSGAGKSSILKMLYGNYAASSGEILIRHGDAMVDLVAASPRLVLAIRRETLGYVSQFLRTVPRVAAVDVVAEPLVARGIDAGTARERAGTTLERLNLPQRLWQLPPATFSGGEQQHRMVRDEAAGDVHALLLDEPTASLDAANRRVVIEMIAEKKAQGVAQIGIFHDEEVREAVADRIIDVRGFAPARAA
jgi:alpha-D-ribose 1-methylphosphonate 5-triphosphate synthase subunit PhnL